MQGMLAHTFHSSTQEAEESGLALCELESNLLDKVSSRTARSSQILYQQTNKQKIQK